MCTLLLSHSQAILRMGLVCMEMFGSQFANWFDQYKTFLSLVMLYSTLFDTLVCLLFLLLCWDHWNHFALHLFTLLSIHNHLSTAMCMNENLDFDQGQYCTDRQTDSVGRVLPLSPFKINNKNDFWTMTSLEACSTGMQRHSQGGTA